jgi:tRNA (cmo5U34)-methyltransferase
MELRAIADMAEQKIFIFEGERAANYDQRISIWMPGYELMHDLVAAIYNHALPEGASILVVGCGTGKELEWLGRTNPTWQLLGVDPSPDMLSITRERLAQLGFRDRISLHEGVASSLPEHILYDAATLVLVLHFFPDDGTKLAILQSIAQRLKPNAPLILIDSCGEAGSVQVTQWLDIYRHYLMQKGISVQQIEERIPQILQNLHLVPEERLVALLIQVGFKSIERFYQGLLGRGWLALRND